MQLGHISVMSTQKPSLEKPLEKQPQKQGSPLPAPPDPKAVEKGGPAGPEPTRYGDWEKGGKCVDF